MVYLEFIFWLFGGVFCKRYGFVKSTIKTITYTPKN